MAGRFLRENQSSRRSIRPYGCDDSKEMAGTAMGKPPSPWRRGCNVPTRMAHLATPLTPEEREVAAIEGWILGVV
jgi:hypothetical protein